MNLPMPKPRPIIASQARSDVLKVSDLIEVAGSTSQLARWRVEGVDYSYPKGARYLEVSRGLSRERLHLDQPTKVAAKRAVFQDVRDS